MIRLRIHQRIDAFDRYIRGPQIAAPELSLEQGLAHISSAFMSRVVLVEANADSADPRLIICCVNPDCGEASWHEFRPLDADLTDFRALLDAADGLPRVDSFDLEAHSFTFAGADDLVTMTYC